jgi:secondary thiamine-phosphate synthase enzyme
VDITKEVKSVVQKSKAKDGICHVFLPGTTAGLMINEMDQFLMEDFKRMFKELIKEERMYAHPENAQSHLRAAMLSQSISLPVSKSNLMLGTWQSILLWEFDIKARTRKIIVTIFGEDKKKES